MGRKEWRHECRCGYKRKLTVWKSEEERSRKKKDILGPALLHEADWSRAPAGSNEGESLSDYRQAGVSSGNPTSLLHRLVLDAFIPTPPHHKTHYYPTPNHHLHLFFFLFLPLSGAVGERKRERWGWIEGRKETAVCTLEINEGDGEEEGGEGDGVLFYLDCEIWKI